MDKAAKELIEKIAGGKVKSRVARYRSDGTPVYPGGDIRTPAERRADNTRLEKRRDAYATNKKIDTAKNVGKGALAAGGTLLASYGAHKAYKYLTKKKDEPKAEEPKKESSMLDKNAAELIQKLAAGETQLRQHMYHSALKDLGQPMRKGPARQSVLDEHAKTFNVPAAPPRPERDRSLAKTKRYLGPPGTDPRELRNKQSSMQTIIDDIIKGAEQNTFGRPVNIQVNSDFTPLDIAKTAGALQALSEQGYSVKQAAEYLGLTERQIQDIVALVR